jgi:hypothetical protein
MKLQRGKLEIATALLTGFLSFVGVVAGAYLTARYSTDQARLTVLSNQRTAAYVQYMDAKGWFAHPTAQISSSARLDKPVLTNREAAVKSTARDTPSPEDPAVDQRRRHDAARYRMAAYASAGVLEALAAYEKALGESDRGARIDAAAGLLKAMRLEMNPDDNADRNTIAKILSPMTHLAR